MDMDVSGWIDRKVIAWSLYDFADTAFSALFITFFFPLLIKVHLGGDEFQIGLAIGLSVVVAALLVPLIGSFLFGRLADKFGPVTMIKTALFVWIAVIALLIFWSSYATFLVAGVLGGVALGAIWTLNRHMIAAISPEQKIAEIFGYEGLTAKFSGVFGPIIFGYLAAFFDYSAALFSLLVFFILGFIIMMKLK